MNAHVIDKSTFNNIKGMLSQAFPNNFVCINVHELTKRVRHVHFCEITGLKIESLDDICLVAIEPFKHTRSININNVAVVCMEAFSFYKDICLFIHNNTDFPNVEHYKNSHLRFELTRDTIVNNNPEVEHINISSYSSLFDNIDKPSSRELSKLTMSLNADAPVINNLKPEKKLNKIRRNIPALNARPKKLESNVFFSERAIKHKIKHFHERSKEKGLSCNLDFENSKYLFVFQYCQLTGMLLSRNPKQKNPLPNVFTIDRLNRFEGYTVANTIVMCYEANQIKADLEKYNYSESTNNLIHILEETKKRILNKYKNNSEYKFKPSKAKTVETIIKNYKDKKDQQIEKRFELI